MRGFAGMRALGVWYARAEVADLMAQIQSQITKAQRKRADKTLAKARTSDSMTAFAKLTRIVDGEPRIICDPPLIERVSELAPGSEGETSIESLHALLRRIDGRCRPIAGSCWRSSGSLTWRARWSGSEASAPVRGSRSCSAETRRIRCSCRSRRRRPRCSKTFTGKSEFGNHGERVVAGQHLMQASSDIFLGWVHVETGLDGQPRDYYVRQLRDWKGSFDDRGACNRRAWALYGRVCGWTLARAHARSGDRIAIAAYLGGGDVFDQRDRRLLRRLRRPERARLHRPQESGFRRSRRGSHWSLDLRLSTNAGAVLALMRRQRNQSTIRGSDKIPDKE